MSYISEMYRVLRLGGEIMFQVLTSKDNRPPLWCYHSINKLKDHMTSIGFKEITEEKEGRWILIRGKK